MLTWIKEIVNSLEMLNSDEGQLNAVFACFGSAAQKAQFFEAALAEFLLTYNRLLKKSLTLGELEVIQAKLQKKTLGALLSDFQKYVKISEDSVSSSLGAALKNRNFLIHSFFLERQKKFRTKRGRFKMLAELVAIDKQLERATNVTNGMRVALCQALEGSNLKESEGEALFHFEVDAPEP